MNQSMDVIQVEEQAPMSKTAGYHLADIRRGKFGELSKIVEEIEEAKDAERQGVKLMVLQELSDAIGAIEGYLKVHHPSVSLVDLVAMARVTQRAFKSGHRAPRKSDAG